MSEVAIRVEDLGKRYRIGAKRASYQTLRESFVSLLASPLHRRRAPQPWQSSPTIWALKDVSFEIKRGEVMGIIGRNGAGKSTLLKILSRITRPTEGQAQVYGRVGSLLEVGTGFHPELTGRENVFLNGAILGMRKAEIRRRFEEIIAFSEIELFLDTPVKRYSSGMYMRLAFAVAAHLETEILLVDEVLAVGDAAFQKKCLGKMGEVAKVGRTVLFVSHNLAAVRNMCSHALLLHKGRIETIGATESVIARYLVNASSEMAATVVLPPGSIEANGQGLSLCFSDEEGRATAQFRLGELWHIIFEFEINRDLPQVIAGVGLITLDMVPLITYWSKPKNLLPGKYRVQFECRVPLSACDIQFAVGISSYERNVYYVQGVGHVSISEVAVGSQPFRASGTGILLGAQESEIEQIEQVHNSNV